MFLKLFRYIAGVNSEAQEIEMTIPVISKLAPSEVSPFLDGIHVRNHEPTFQFWILLYWFIGLILRVQASTEGQR